MLGSPAVPQVQMASSPPDDWLFVAAYEVRDRCFCLHLQAAARAVADRFDAALKPLGLTSGEYSLLVMLSRPQPPRAVELERLLVMEPDVLVAALAPLERRGLLTVESDPFEEHGYRLQLTTAGFLLLAQALAAWRSVHESLSQLLAGSDAGALRGDLLALAFGEP
ncbi:MarR family winged helix-turn-helix transcriptional regulator [Pelagibius sp. 7325]|uniref:MarR family winged helix-turn-helix transcriptional regulator n=1 Tax=Pelagibius sp. 7325 TaxID=3131994 RepID=UPI0030EDA964